MDLVFLTRFWKATRRSAKKSRAQAARAYYRPRVRGFEDRIVPSTFAAPAMGPALLGAALPSAPAAQNPVNVIPIKITDVLVHNGRLVAQGTLDGHSFSAPLTVTASPNAADPTCPILNLQLAPIHLNLLGLHVDTSAICASVTAQSGSGHLLGNLLCDVANLLNQGLPLQSILGGLTTNQLNTLTRGTTSLLNGVLHDVTAPASGSLSQAVSVTSTPGHVCNVLNLSLGPVNLNLLGLNVHVDNCANGPVKVSVTAKSGPGQLLGNLVCDLASLLDNNATTAALTSELSRIAGAIRSLAIQPVTAAPLAITGIAIQDGMLLAQGTLGGASFTAPLTLTAQPNAADPTCPILNLQLAPIHLNLLGLHVDTSAICLNITAQSGSGNLLGNLLCDVANLLNSGTPLSSVLSGLTSTQLHRLTNGLTSMLDRVFHDVTTPAPAAIRQDVSVTTTPTSDANILNLSLGPVNLNLLGLMVHLDNCANGPVTVSVTAQPGAGNLLGNLLAGLSHLLDSNATTTALENSLSHVAGAINALA